MIQAKRLQEALDSPFLHCAFPWLSLWGTRGSSTPALSTHFQQNPSYVLLLSLLFLQWGKPSTGLELLGVGGSGLRNVWKWGNTKIWKQKSYLKRKKKEMKAPSVPRGAAQAEHSGLSLSTRGLKSK